MCLNPLYIRNPTRRLVSGTKFMIQVPCNKCAECCENKQREWQFRTFHEVTTAFANNCYIYVDTLTYSDEYLPKLSSVLDIDKYDMKDISCFDNKNYQDFLKRLRRRLERIVKGYKLRYFMTSEYGVNENYTKRPHYHIMFFLPNEIEPLKFSELVSECWYYGRTEGIKFKPLKHVAKNVFGYDIGFGKKTSPKDVLRISRYICKYVTKDSLYNKTLLSKLNYVRKHVDEETFKSVRSSIDMIHRQSVGFGLSFLNTLDNEEYIDFVTIEDDSKVVVKLRLPQYYIRKLYYDLKKREDKTYYWELNKKGVEQLENKIIKDIDNTYETLYQDYINLSEDKQCVIDSYLCNKTLYDVSIYKCIYKDRLILNSIHNELPEKYENIYDYLDDEIKISTQVNSLEFCYLYKFNPDSTVYEEYNPITFSYDKYDTKYLESRVINEQSSLLFKNFDKILKLFEYEKKQKSHTKQCNYEEKQRILEIYKYLTLIHQ